MDQITRGFLHGLAYSVSWVLQAHGEESLALELLAQSGHDYNDLLKAGCDSYDLMPIAKALGLRIDGKPRKGQEGITWWIT